MVEMMTITLQLSIILMQIFFQIEFSSFGLASNDRSILHIQCQEAYCLCFHHFPTFLEILFLHYLQYRLGWLDVDVSCSVLGSFILAALFH